MKVLGKRKLSPGGPGKGCIQPSKARRPGTSYFPVCSHIVKMMTQFINYLLQYIILSNNVYGYGKKPLRSHSKIH